MTQNPYAIKAQKGVAKICPDTKIKTKKRESLSSPL
jgi:hypothetical protein